MLMGSWAMSHDKPRSNTTDCEDTTNFKIVANTNTNTHAQTNINLIQIQNIGIMGQRLHLLMLMGSWTASYDKLRSCTTDCEDTANAKLKTASNTTTGTLLMLYETIMHVKGR